ncbi:TonB-dependent receptor [Penaeicola halotolerans]|uniref:TonB-dependent receptor n=1 Tax=Penaeicola halotolerans TaxID=2793196 RepID=UPI001CF80914|nr:carboxypeptidase regulatory-like domain-containing protein [Penaeicola halotolerans]
MNKLYFVILILTLLMTHSALSQETTGNLSGNLKETTGETIPFANVIALNTETGISYRTTSNEAGYFILPQLPPFNNYTVTVTFIGYKSERLTNVSVNLGKTTSLSIVLQPDEISLDEVVITARTNELLKKSESIGNEATISENLISSLPTKNRSLQDVTNVLSEANLNSFGGASFRFNNLSIDGSATNDVLGFQEPASGASGALASGTPGGLAGTQPIGFGAIKDLSVKQTPFDVSIGNFTGASINVITKNGTNTFKTEVYGFLKDKNLIGSYAAGEKQETTNFSDIQTGISFSGPIIKNKLFFFTNVEFASRNENLLNAPGSSTSEIPLEIVQGISDTLKSRYNYDPGIFQNGNIAMQSTKFFLRFDYNINKNNNLTVRGNLVNGFADNLEWTTNSFNFGNQGYRHKTLNYSIVSELKTTLSSKWYNKLIISNTNVEDERTYDGEVFPHLEISYNTTNRIFAGTYREAAVYGASLNTSQITNNLSYYSGKHAIMLGGSLEFNTIEYRFLTAFNGRWQYNSVDDLFNDRPVRIRGVYNIENNDFDLNKRTPSADFNVLLGGIYLQDEIRLSEKLNVIIGLRTDIQYTTTTFPLSQEVRDTPEFADLTNQITTRPQVNPRFGFTYDLKADKSLVIRGGTGLFNGRMPFLWYAYANYISGTRYFNVDVRPTSPTPIVRDVSDFATTGSNIAEINLIDNDFNLPKDWKSSIAIDKQLDKNTRISIEATYSKVLQGLLFQSINRKDSIGNFAGTDNRPYYLTSNQSIKINENFTNVFLLTNTNRGYRYSLTASITKSQKRYDGHLAYTYGVSKDVSSTVRSSHAANFEWNQAIVANNPDLSFSNFDLRHKIVSYHFYKIPLKTSLLKLGGFINSRSGSPFTFVYAGDINRDGSSRNDLVFIPGSREDIVLVPIRDNDNNVLVSAEQQWQQLDAYIENDQYLSKNRGKYAERNGARTPWNHSVDLNISYQKTLGKKDNILELSLDIFNFTNLINRNWGKQHFVPNLENSSFSLLEFQGIVANQPTFQFNDPSGTPWQIDPLASRWQGQLGLKYAF